MGGFAGGDDDADVWEGDPKGAEELNHLAVGEGVSCIGLMEVVLSAGVGTHSGEGDGELSLPASLHEILEVCGESECFPAPVGETEEGTDADAPEATGVGAFGAFEAPLEVFLWSGGVELAVGFLVVGFLVDDESFRAGKDEFGILVVFHRADLDSDGGDEGLDGGDALLEVAFGDELGVFAGDEEEVAESLGVEVTGLLDDLVHGEGGAEDGVVAGESAVFAVIDALVGEVEGGEEPHGGPKMAAGDGGAASGEGFQLAVRKGFEVALELLEEGGFPLGEISEPLDETHR